MEINVSFPGALCLVLALLAQSPVLGIRLCQRNVSTATYMCQDAPKTILKSLDFPNDSCHLTNCDGCIRATRTFLWTTTGSLLHPSSFFEKPTTANGSVPVFSCLTSDSRSDLPLHCDCSSNCTGSDTFCSLVKCVDQATCHCDVQKVNYELSHTSSQVTLINPTLVSMDICLFRIPVKHRKQRNLLEYEGATFSLNNLTIHFHDPVVTLPAAGKLIARVSGNEIIIPVENDLNIVLPPEFLQFKDTLTLIFISNSGQAVHGDVSLEGKTICRLANCVFCKELVLYIQCWPSYVSYIFYTFFILLLLILLCFLKWACRGLLSAIRTLSLIFYVIIVFLKSFLRFFLLIGALLGQTVRNYINYFLQFLEHQNQQRQMNILVLLLYFIVMINGDCTTHSILSTDTKNCQTVDQKLVCTLQTTAELTFKGIGYEACIWFQDQKRNSVFNLKMKLLAAHCTFSTKRTYFTFPVKQRSVSQLACPQNYYCAWGEHCKNDQRFEALTEESLDYPGYTDCHPSSVGSGCTIISRMGCLFYRVYFIPDLLRSYEVRSIQGHQCTYTISLERSHNNTITKLSFQSSTVTTDGIYLEILGAYNQAPIHISDSLVLRVGNPAEAYLVPTSPANRPMAGWVGQVQANTSYTKHFLFDRDMVKCSFFETSLRCETKPDALQVMYTSQDRALPLTQDLHLFTIEKGVLKSTLLSTAPVRLQLHFQDYQISLEIRDVCPKFSTSVFQTKGCYSCQILSELSFTAFSTCDAGTVSIEFQILTLFSQSIILETEPREFVIKFLAEQKCYDEKLCLVSRNMKSCQQISFCLQEPSLHLLQLNTSYTTSYLKDDSSGSGFFNFFSLPTFNNIFMSLKMLGAFLLIICLSITIFSTIITCCRK